MSLIEMNLDSQLIKRFLSENRNGELISYLSERFKVVREDVTGEVKRFNINKTDLDLLSLIFEENHQTDTIQQVFKSLRNCVNNPETQRLVVDHPIVSHAIDCLETDYAPLILQFLANCSVNNSECSLRLWKLTSHCVIPLLPKSYYAAAFFYNVLHLNRTLHLPVEVYDHILTACACETSPNDYYIFALDLLVQNPRFIQVFEELANKTQALRYLIQTEVDLDTEGVKRLIGRFKRKSDCVLKTSASYVDQIEPDEVVLLLELLGILSAKEKYLPVIQSDSGLLINSVFLLRSVHEVGKTAGNVFTPVVKAGDGDESSPVFGFKANLIRLLGNMCWKNAANQNEVRELEGIQVLLDCCSIDARNPFITQWCILAIRNLCENNAENQRIIASMSQSGVVDSAVLQSLGLTLQDTGNNKIGIVSMDVFKK